MSVPDTVRHASRGSCSSSYPVLGFNYRMTDIQAAIGREQLQPAAGDRGAPAGAGGALRRRCWPACPAWSRRASPSGRARNWQSYAVRLEQADLRAVMQRMLDDGIATRRGVMNAHKEAAYPEGTWRAAGSLAESERAHSAGPGAAALPPDDLRASRTAWWRRSRGLSRGLMPMLSILTPAFNESANLRGAARAAGGRDGAARAWTGNG